MDEFLKKWDGKVFVQEDDGPVFKTQVVAGKLRDVGFLPQRVHNECSEGYQWMTLIPADKQGKFTLFVALFRIVSFSYSSGLGCYKTPPTHFY